MKNKRNNSRLLSVLLSLSMTVGIYGCKPAEPENNEALNVSESVSPVAEGKDNEADEKETSDVKETADDNEELEALIQDLIIENFSYSYDVFDAIVFLDNGMQIKGLGYTDYSAYYETDDGKYGFFPAGFISYTDEPGIPEESIENGLEIYDEEYSDRKYGFVHAYSADSVIGHFVREGMYVQYGIDENGKQYYTSQPFSREVCDTSIGALYSFDEEKYLYDTDVGNYIPVTGVSLVNMVDFKRVEEEVNAVLENQDNNFSRHEIETIAYSAKEALNSYWLSVQTETFMGYEVAELIKEAETIDPTECIQFSPEGYAIVDMNPATLKTKKDVAKWAIGVSCGIFVAGATAMSIFVPATRPVSALISGAAVQIFCEVVMENKDVSDINWNKVAVAATSAALLAWACPLAASKTTYAATKLFENPFLGKLFGYGVQTLGNGLISGATAAAMAVIDKKETKEVLNSFLTGAAVGAACTVAFAVVGELGQAAFSAIEKTSPNSWLVRASTKMNSFIGKHQIHLKNNSVLEDILNPKSVYASAKAASFELEAQLSVNGHRKNGGSYSEVSINPEKGKVEAHETPAFSATGSPKRNDGPAIRMTVDDHGKTASWGSSKQAIEYRQQQAALIKNKNYKAAIQMDIDDIHSKFGNKYDEAITEMLEYAESIGWWW